MSQNILYIILFFLIFNFFPKQTTLPLLCSFLWRKRSVPPAEAGQNTGVALHDGLPGGRLLPPAHRLQLLVQLHSVSVPDEGFDE